MPQAPNEYWYNGAGALVAYPDPTSKYLAYPKGSAMPVALIPAGDKPPMPTLASISPTTARAGKDVTITLIGLNFSSWCRVQVGGANASWSAFISPLTMQATIKAAAPGTVPITVRDDYAQTTAVNFVFT